MFSDIYNQEWSKVKIILSQPSADDLLLKEKEYVHNAVLSASLLTLKPELRQDIFQSILNTARSKKESLFSNRIFAIVPLYVTSICEEHCQYCNYRAGNKIQIDRYRLDEKEVISEAKYLIEKGYHSIELVYASDSLFRVDSICRHIELVRQLLESVNGGIVGLNAEAFEEKEYSLLNDAGLDFVVLWQETYDRAVYEEMHPGATKKNKFEFRLNAYERMLSAGLSHIGMGVLSGIADWRHDWAMLLMHQEYLRNNFDYNPPIIGIPRLKSSEGAVIKTTAYIPTDDEFLMCIAIQAIFDPLSLPFVNTRESWDLCLKMSIGGGVLFTFNCSTIPGGYSLGHRGYQFPTFDFDIQIYEEKANNAGLKTELKWTL